MKGIDASKTDAIGLVYMLLAKVFSFPDANLRALITTGKEHEILKTTIAKLPFEVELRNLPLPSIPLEELAIFYITTFDMKEGGGPPCPLYEGLIRKDEGREGIMMELLRFYHYFDVRLHEKEKDFPDHLTTELEFMAYLSQKEAMAMNDGRDPQPYRIAQMDFLERHMGKWVPLLDERIKKRVEEPFYHEISSVLRRFIDAHTIYLKGLTLQEKVVNLREEVRL